MKNAALLFLALALTTSYSKAEPMPTGENDYFQQFLFENEGSCAIPSRLSFKEVSTWKPFELGLDGQVLQLADLNLQLFKDGTYYASYSEFAPKEIDHLGVYVTTFQKELTGIWVVKCGKLYVIGIGTGLPSKISDSFGNQETDGISFQFDTAIHDSRILNATVKLGHTSTNVGPKGISIDTYCGFNP